MQRIAAWLAVLGLSLPALPNPAWACGTCASGSPALTLAGQGQPSAGRLRITVEARLRREHAWQSKDRLSHTIEEAVLSTGVALAPTDRLWLLADVPWVFRSVRFAGLESATTVGLSDVRLQGRYVVFRNRSWAPRHLLGVSAEVSLPTPMTHRSRFASTQPGQQSRLPTAAQSGTGALGLGAGLFYWHFADPFAVFFEASAVGVVATRWDAHPGHALQGQATGQFRLDDRWSLRLGVEARGNLHARDGVDVTNREDRLAVYLTPAVLFAPKAGWLVLLGSQIPVWEGSSQGLRESPIGHLSVTLDV